MTNKKLFHKKMTSHGFFFLALVCPFLFLTFAFKCFGFLNFFLFFLFTHLFFDSHSLSETKRPEEVLKKTEDKSLQFRRFFFLCSFVPLPSFFWH
ncbi:hypothetical protein XELAEV_18035564mg [Xenopus laevis]|uniref:Uncharacterized protein n=1 Tax=Xenopus laevis TaxID=8355 RepID=A0A974CG63_XENLA|nr:hypothetical protein XELAEV_18035564mg [Xenopus laevis]